MKQNELNYDYPQHFSNDVWEAIELVENLSATGKYDLFRGQRHVFGIQPSILREHVDADEALNELNRFASWVHRTQDLASLHGNDDSILAVAQHYGLKTPFLDFTSSPKIAGFFATDGGEEGDTGTIICIQRDRFIESWSDFNKRHIAKEGFPVVDIIDVDVQNLWRLQAQKGSFLRCHVDENMLEMFSHMLHIYFPQKAGVKVLEHRDVYPDDKSHLEVLLDQYFLIEDYPKRRKRAKEAGYTVIQVSGDGIEQEIASFFKDNNLPEIHPSWLTDFAKCWLNEPDERYVAGQAANTTKVVVPTEPYSDELASKVAEELLSHIATTKGKRPILRWNVVFKDGSLAYDHGEGITNEESKWSEYSVSDVFNEIYAGMRNLPFTDQQIARSLSRYLLLITFDLTDLFPDYSGIEFEGAGVRARGFCSRSRFRKALRDEYDEYFKPDKLQGMKFRDYLYTARYASRSFDFERFVELCVEDLIPTQAATAVEGLVFVLNPMKIDGVGES